MGKRRSLRFKDGHGVCNGKIIYAQEKHAKTAASRARKNSGLANIFEYPCPEASHYHIGKDRYRPHGGKQPLARGAHAKVPRRPAGPRLRGTDSRGAVGLERMGRLAAKLWATDEETEEGV